MAEIIAGKKQIDNWPTATWRYEMTDERRPRWRCSNCGKIAHKHPRDKRYCSWCGCRMEMES